LGSRRRAEVMSAVLARGGGRVGLTLRGSVAARGDGTDRMPSPGGRLNRRAKGRAATLD
jgi:hypothetical protein